MDSCIYARLKASLGQTTVLRFPVIL